MLVFDERVKPEYPGKNLSWQSRGPTNSIHMTPSEEIKPGPHWWKASALTTRRTLPPKMVFQGLALFLYMPQGITVVSPTCQFANDQFTNFEVDLSTSNVWTVLFIAFTCIIQHKYPAWHLIPNEEINSSNSSIWSVRAIDSFVYMFSCNMIGRAKTKTRKFGWKELGRPIRKLHCGHIATRQHHHKKQTEKWQ